MPLYMIQARFTSEAWDALYRTKVDRRQVLSKMLEDAGGRLIDYYFAFGDSDVVVITEAPDNGTAASAVIAVARAGAVTEVRTTVLMSYEEGIQAIQRSGEMGYSPPGA
jgi:uncharacterized protein with GYD domain